jgi:hypothetical protein
VARAALVIIATDTIVGERAVVAQITVGQW